MVLHPQHCGLVVVTVSLDCWDLELPWKLISKHACERSPCSGSLRWEDPAWMWTAHIPWAVVPEKIKKKKRKYTHVFISPAWWCQRPVTHFLEGLPLWRLWHGGLYPGTVSFPSSNLICQVLCHRNTTSKQYSSTHHRSTGDRSSVMPRCLDSLFAF